MSPQYFRTWITKPVEQQQILYTKRRSDTIDQEIAEICQLGRRYRDTQIVLMGRSQCESYAARYSIEPLKGTALSGKSTFTRQIEILYKDGLSDEQLMEHRPIIFRTVISSAQAVIRAMQGLQLNCLDNNNLACLQHIQDFQLDPMHPWLPPTTADMIHQFWQDPIIPLVINGHWKVVTFPDNAR